RRLEVREREPGEFDRPRAELLMQGLNRVAAFGPRPVRRHLDAVLEIERRHAPGVAAQHGFRVCIGSLYHRWIQVARDERGARAAHREAGHYHCQTDDCCCELHDDLPAADVVNVSAAWENARALTGF